MEGVAIDQAGERRERQIGAIDRMRAQQRIAGRRFDGPEIVELDDEAVILEQWRAGDLTLVVKSDRRIRIFPSQSRRRIEIPAELAVLHFEIDRKRDEKPIGHGVDERRHFLTVWVSSPMIALK